MVFLKVILLRTESEHKLNFKSEYNGRIRDIDSYIEDYINRISDIEPILKDGMKYAVLNGGKRLRSILCTEICNAFSGSKDNAMPFAAAIEFIHAYSLVHDDLPAMDNADSRRGLPSCHKKYGEDIAILIGDALLNTAFEIMLKYADNTYAVSVMRTIANAAGIHGMINGQVQDLSMLDKDNVIEDDIIRLIEQKTMALIRCAAVSGAIIAGCSNEEIQAVDKYAYYLGLAFQIRDDFEDYSEDEADEHSSPNFINILGFESAKEKLMYCANESTMFLEQVKNNRFLKELNFYLFPEV